MHCRANFCAARVRRSFSFWIYSVVRNRALKPRLARLRQRAGGRSGFAGDLRRRQGCNIASPGGKRVATPVGGALLDKAAELNDKVEDVSLQNVDVRAQAPDVAANVICDGFSVAEQENTRPRRLRSNNITREIHVAAHRGSRGKRA
jgi:hypothetical protein